MSHTTGVFGTISEMLQAQGVARPDAPTIRAVERSGFGALELDAFTRDSATVLAGLGLEKGDRVAIVLPNGPEMATAFLSVIRIATAAPLNPGLKQSEFEFYLGDLDARAVIAAESDPTEGSAAARKLGIPIIELRPDPGGVAGAFRFGVESGSPAGPVPEAEPGDIALVLHTSGTTAKPKIVPLSHGNLCRSAASVAQTLDLRPGDRCLNVMPLFHIHGLVAALLASLSRGASVVCTPGFRAPSFFDWMAAAGPTWYTAVPTMHQAILSRARERERDMVGKSGLRLIRSSSASLPPTVLRETEEAFGVPVIEAYGMTEAAHQMASNPLPPGARKPGSVGPAAGPEVAIADAAGAFLAPREVGEVVIRGPNVTRGYHGMEDQSAYFFGEGWFRTGDQGYLDEDGYLFLTGRLKEIINRGGETIAPREIDEALLEHPAVIQAVAFSVPDRDLGEEVAAAVILVDGASETEGDLQSFLMSRLSWARMPKRILVLDEIPKGPTGKLQRIGLAEKLGLESVRKVYPVGPGSNGAAGSRGPESSSEEGSTVEAALPETLRRVAFLWREVLQNPDVGPDDSFLDAGGDSVTATMLVIRVEQEFTVKVPLLAFFDAATIRRQALLIDRLVSELPANP